MVLQELKDPSHCDMSPAGAAASAAAAAEAAQPGNEGADAAVQIQLLVHQELEGLVETVADMQSKLERVLTPEASRPRGTGSCTAASDESSVRGGDDAPRRSIALSTESILARPTPAGVAAAHRSRVRETMTVRRDSMASYAEDSLRSEAADDERTLASVVDEPSGGSCAAPVNVPSSPRQRRGTGSRTPPRGSVNIGVAGLGADQASEPPVNVPTSPRRRGTGGGGLNIGAVPL